MERSKTIRVKACALLLLGIAVAGCSGKIYSKESNPGMVRGFSCAVVKSGLMTMTVDSIDYRSDLTRVYGSFKGMPHTSFRVDDIRLTAGGATYNATDIDGVDIRRWFQWEDEGSIPVEIDFPRMKPAKEFSVEVTGPKGGAVWKYTKKASSKKTSNKRKR